LIRINGRFKRIRRAVLFLSAFAVAAAFSRAGGVSQGPGVPFIARRDRPEPENGKQYKYGSRWLDRRLLYASEAENRKLLLSSPNPPADGLSNADFLSGGRAVVQGVVRVPVLTGVYSDHAGSLQSVEELQMELFDGPWQTGTMAEYFDEVSGLKLSVTGTVFDWVPLSGAEIYYTGGFYCNGICPEARTDEMIAEIVAGNDPLVDYGLFDNDGPDGVPNSGDDDGFVDVIIIVQPQMGGECFGDPDHMISHSYKFSLWGDDGAPLLTGDPSASGGFIKIDDYNLAPAVSCEGGLIEIGVFCHEFGHFLGLPDLYDTYGGTGIGYWGLMGTGNWNTPESPAHLCGWSKEQLGWVDVIDIGWEEVSRPLEPVETARTVYRLILPTERFRRNVNVLPITGYSLICGYNGSEAAARGYRGGMGYGNGWNESMVRSFHFDGTTPCVLQFNVGVDIEEGYDYLHLILDHPEGADTLASYTGTVNPVAEQFDLGQYLPGAPCDYMLRFVFVSDFNFSDEDGGWLSSDGWSANIDRISVSGGGVDYFCDFETDAGGWRSASPPAEYFLVERRKRTGFDSHLPAEGMIVYHAENSIAYSSLANTGGYTNTQARGVVVEEADGLYEMIKFNDPLNHGDGGDPFPGSSANVLFSNATVPSSRTNGNAASNARISGITMASAFFRAGMAAPIIASFEPISVDKAAGSEFTMDISGSGFIYGAGCRLTRDGVDIDASEVEWLGENRVIAFFDGENLYAGEWDLVLVNGDGQTAAAAGTFLVESVFLDARVRVDRSFLEVSWAVDTGAGDLRCVLSRSDDGGAFIPVEADTFESPSGIFSFEDESVAPGVGYRYMIRAFSGEIGETLLVPGTYSIEEILFVLDGNFPNPFSERTSIRFFVPFARTVRIDIYDAAGRRVLKLAEDYFTRGTHEVEWAPAGDVASGIYFCRLKSGFTEKTIKIVRLR